MHRAKPLTHRLSTGSPHVRPQAPARTTEHFETKILVYEAMAFDADEIARTRTSWMVEAAMQRDAVDLGINLSKIAVEPGGSPSRH